MTAERERAERETAESRWEREESRERDRRVQMGERREQRETAECRWEREESRERTEGGGETAERDSYSEVGRQYSRWERDRCPLSPLQDWPH